MIKLYLCLNNQCRIEQKNNLQNPVQCITWSTFHVCFTYMSSKRHEMNNLFYYRLSDKYKFNKTTRKYLKLNEPAQNREL